MGLGHFKTDGKSQSRATMLTAWHTPETLKKFGQIFRLDARPLIQNQNGTLIDEEADAFACG